MSLLLPLIFIVICTSYGCLSYEIPDEVTAGRLGHWGGTRPLKYDITMTIVDHKMFKIDTSIKIKVVEKTNQVFVHLDSKYLRNGDKPSLLDRKGRKIKSTKFEQRDDVLVLSNSKALLPGNIYFVNFNNYEALKAKFDFRVRHKKSVLVSGNGALESKKQIQFGGNDEITLMSKFTTTPLMSSYLFSFAIGEGIEMKLGKIPLKGGRFIPLEVICPPNMKEISDKTCTRIMKILSDVASNTIDNMEAYTKIPFPMPKLGYVWSPMYFSGAMENMGLVASKADIASDLNTMAHEIIHHWFGNIVTNQDFHHVCLQEGLTSYFANHMVKRLRISTVEKCSMNGENSPLCEALTGIKTLGNIGKCYQRGEIIFSIMSDVIGYVRFNQGNSGINRDKVVEFVKILMEKCAYNSCNAPVWLDALRSVDSEYALNASKILESALKFSGYPVIRAEIGNSNKLMLTRNIYNGLQKGVDDRINPIIYVDGLGNKIRSLMVKSQQNFTLRRGINLGEENSNSWFDLYAPDVNSNSRYWGYLIYPLENYINALTSFAQKNISRDRLKNIFLAVENAEFISRKEFPKDGWNKILNLIQNIIEKEYDLSDRAWYLLDDLLRAIKNHLI